MVPFPRTNFETKYKSQLCVVWVNEINPHFYTWQSHPVGVLCCVVLRSETATHQSWHPPRWRDKEEQQSGGGRGGAVPLEIKTQKNELWVVCVSLRPSGADIQHLLCGISFVLILLHCRPARPLCRCRGRARCRATPCRAPTSPPPRARPPTTRPRRAAVSRCASPSPGYPTITTSRGRAPQKK